MSMFRDLLYQKKENGGIDEHTLLMLHCDDFKDSSIYNVASQINSITIDNDIFKFGTGSFDRVPGSYSSACYQSNIEEALSTYTIDFWYYHVAMGYGGTSRYIVFDKYFYQSDVNNGYEVRLEGETSNRLRIQTSNGTSSIVQMLVNISISGWTHIAITYDGDTLKLYINGILTNSVDTKTAQLGAISKDYRIMYANNYLSTYCKYRLDEFRLSNIVRWTENFIPLVKPYS